MRNRVGIEADFLKTVSDPATDLQAMASACARLRDSEVDVDWDLVNRLITLRWPGRTLGIIQELVRKGNYRESISQEGSALSA